MVYYDLFNEGRIQRAVFMLWYVKHFNWKNQSVRIKWENTQKLSVRLYVQVSVVDRHPTDPHVKTSSAAPTQSPGVCRHGNTGLEKVEEMLTRLPKVEVCEVQCSDLVLMMHVKKNTATTCFFSLSAEIIQSKWVCFFFFFLKNIIHACCSSYLLFQKQKKTSWYSAILYFSPNGNVVTE